MTNTIQSPSDAKLVFPGELTELIRGKEQTLLAKVTPQVRRQSVTLDLGRVRRIDAGGIGALLSLYASAREAGHSFAVANLTPRVAEILELVGLKFVFLSHIVATKSQSGTNFKDSSKRKCLSGHDIPAL
jgi:anti-anti-sigma factor